MDYKSSISISKMDSLAPLEPWEAKWAPYDEETYQTALNYVQSHDVVLDIGAGDLRLTRRIAKIAHHVYAIETQQKLLTNQKSLLNNMTIIYADARCVTWPKDITLGVLLMRHCTHVSTYVAKLRALGCRQLITNARWRLSVELMSLGERTPWSKMELGWYACTCGQTGFVPAPPKLLTEAHTWQVTEVETCPNCTVIQ